MQTVLRDKWSMKWCEKHQKRVRMVVGGKGEEKREMVRRGGGRVLGKEKKTQAEIGDGYVSGPGTCEFTGQALKGKGRDPNGNGTRRSGENRGPDHHDHQDKTNTTATKRRRAGRAIRHKHRSRARREPTGGWTACQTSFGADGKGHNHGNHHGRHQLHWMDQTRLAPDPATWGHGNRGTGHQVIGSDGKPIHTAAENCDGLKIHQDGHTQKCTCIHQKERGNLESTQDKMQVTT